jgi:hypothetical protein
VFWFVTTVTLNKYGEFEQVNPFYPQVNLCWLLIVLYLRDHHFDMNIGYISMPGGAGNLSHAKRATEMPL